MSTVEHFPVPEYARANPDENHGGLLFRSAVVMACLSTTAVALRFLSRKLTRVPLLADDWIILAALPFSLMICSIDIYGALRNNFGRHLQYSTPEDLRRFFQATFTFEIAYNFAITLPKYSMLALYARVFGFEAFKWPLIITTFITTLFFLACSFTAIFACDPISDYWNNPSRGTCLNHINYYIGQAAANISLDIVLMLLPIIPIRRLQMSLSQKIAVSAIFFIGIFVTICSGLRLERLVNTKRTTAIDPTFALVDAAVWSVIETNLAVLCACLPSMRPLLRAMLHGKFRSTNGSVSRQSGNRRSVYDSTVAANQKRRSQAIQPQAYGGINKEQHTAVTSAQGIGNEVELGYYATVTAQHDTRNYRRDIKEEAKSLASSTSSRKKKWGWRSKEQTLDQHETSWGAARSSSESVEDSKNQQPDSWPLGHARFDHKELD